MQKMEEKVNGRGEEIGRKYIDLKRIMAAKGVKTGPLTRALLGRILHVKELNEGIYEHRNEFGLYFV